MSLHPPLTRVHYAFCTEGMTEAGIHAHAAFAKDEICAQFALSPANVIVHAKARLPEDEPFVITCYVHKCTEAAATALAAKRILPHLFRKGLGWTSRVPPGTDLETDLEGLEALAAGILKPTPAEAAWVSASLAQFRSFKPDVALPHQARLLHSALLGV